jgi:hypothetical protein
LAAIENAAPYLESNPRRIKRFVNLLRLHAFIAARRNLLVRPGDESTLAKAVVISMRWPGKADMLIADARILREAWQVARAQETQRETQTQGSAGDTVEQPGHPRRSTYDVDSHAQQILDNAELVRLLATLNEPEVDKLHTYLQLTRITATTLPAQPPEPLRKPVVRRRASRTPRK